MCVESPEPELMRSTGQGVGSGAGFCRTLEETPLSVLRTRRVTEGGAVCPRSLSEFPAGRGPLLGPGSLAIPLTDSGIVSQPHNTCF